MVNGLKSDDLVIDNLIRFSEGEGKIFLGDQRVVLVQASALGTLRQDLIQTLGMDRTKGFLTRYGYNIGANDAQKILQMPWLSEKERLWAGPKMHGIIGHVFVQPLITEYDFQRGVLHFEGDWKDSYEAMEHIRLFGVSKEPVCHTLVGYASGYLSTIMGTKVIVREEACQGMGDDHCRWVGKTLEHWHGEVDGELIYYEERSLVRELDQAYERLKIERDNLDKAILIHNKLMHEVIRGHDLPSIADLLSKLMKKPVLIEDHHLNVLAVGGLSGESAEASSLKFKQWMERQNDHRLQRMNAVEIKVSEDCRRLIAPIVLRNTIYGYCSFLHADETFKEVDAMILEKAASACSIYLLNEKNVFEAEQRVRGHFLEEILSNRLSKKDIFKKGHYIGVDLERPFYIVVLDYFAASSKVNDELELYDNLITTISKFLIGQDMTPLLSQRSGHIAMWFPQFNTQNQKIDIERVCRQLIEHCKSAYPRYQFKSGISLGSASIDEIANEYAQALAALKVADNKHHIMPFESLGLAGIIFQSGNVDTIRKFSNQILGKMLSCDKNKNAEILGTLYFYLKNGGNLEQTAQEMSLSISGLRYRVKKITDLLQKDLREPTTMYKLYLAVQALVAIGDLDLNSCH